jgi:hypothetical protein
MTTRSPTSILKLLREIDEIDEMVAEKARKHRLKEARKSGGRLRKAKANRTPAQKADDLEVENFWKGIWS